MHHIWFGKGLRESIAAPVIFVDAKNDLWFEANFDKVNERTCGGRCSCLTVRGSLVRSFPGPFFLELSVPDVHFTLVLKKKKNFITDLQLRPRCRSAGHIFFLKSNPCSSVVGSQEVE